MHALKLQIGAVGKLKEQYWRQARDEYLKRLQGYAQVKICEVDDVDPKRVGGEAQARAREAANLQRALAGSLSRSQSQSQSHVYRIALDIQGKETSSEQLAQLITRLTVQNTNTMVFMIGGPNGLDQDLLAGADLRMSFGPITLPHNLALIVLCEQLYRSFKIIKHEPYHK